MPFIKHMSEEEGEAMPVNQLHENLTGNQAVRAASCHLCSSASSKHSPDTPTFQHRIEKMTIHDALDGRAVFVVLPTGRPPKLKK